MSCYLAGCCRTTTLACKKLHLLCSNLCKLTTSYSLYLPPAAARCTVVVIEAPAPAGSQIHMRQNALAHHGEHGLVAAIRERALKPAHRRRRCLHAPATTSVYLICFPMQGHLGQGGLLHAIKFVRPHALTATAAALHAPTTLLDIANRSLLPWSIYNLAHSKINCVVW